MNETVLRWVFEVPAGPGQGATARDIKQAALQADAEVEFENHPTGSARIRLRFPDERTSVRSAVLLKTTFVPDRASIFAGPFR